MTRCKIVKRERERKKERENQNICLTHYRPHALQSNSSCADLRQRGVVVALQLVHTGRGDGALSFVVTPPATDEEALEEGEPTIMADFLNLVPVS